MGLTEIMDENRGLAGSLDEAMGSDSSDGGNDLGKDDFSEVDESEEYDDTVDSEEDEEYYGRVEDRAVEEFGEKHIEKLKEELEYDDFHEWLEDYDDLPED